MKTERRCSPRHPGDGASARYRSQPRSTLTSMTWWDKIKRITKREAAAVKEELGKAADALDDALAKKERELNATPAERVDMLLDEIADEDANFGDLESRVRGEGIARAEAAGIDPPIPAASPEPRADGIRATTTVEELDPATSPDRISHAAHLDGHVMAALGKPGFEATIADLQVEVMVLDVVADNDRILLRTPTLSVDAVADLVARAAARHVPPAFDTPPPDLGDSEV